MVNVNYFRNYINYLSNKANSGLTQTTDDFNTTAMAAQLVPFSRDLETFISTKVVSNYLQSFLTLDYVQQLDPLNNIISYPPDFQALSSAGNYFDKTQNDADLVDDTDWYEMLRPNSLNYPTNRNPKYKQAGSGIMFLPKDTGTVYLNYFHTPAQPIWNFTVVNNEEVYNPIGSVDFEFDLFSINQVAAVFLQMVGINLNDDAISEFSKQFTVETALPL